MSERVEGNEGIPGSVESSGFALRTRETGSPLEWRDIACRLWMLLDDIDTASDAAKADDAAFREFVELHQRRRFDLLPGHEIDRWHAQSSSPCAADGGEAVHSSFPPAEPLPSSPLPDLLREVVEALKPFAEITPSSLYADDGSEAERYVVRLYDGSRHEPPHDFTGADLAKLRAARSHAQEIMGDRALISNTEASTQDRGASVAGVQAAPDGATDEQHSAGCWFDCPHCAGRGRLVGRTARVCSKCRGFGRFWCEDPVPDASSPTPHSEEGP